MIKSASFLDYAFITLFFLAIPAGAYIFKRSIKDDWANRVIKSILPVFSVLFSGLFIQKLLAPPFTWVALRMATAFAMTHGYKVYYAQQVSGPLLNTVYPPMGFLAYWPAMLFSNPQFLIFAAQLLAILFISIPMILAIFWVKDDSGRNIWQSVLMITYFITLIFYLHPLIDVTFCPHVDAPAIGFGAMACFFIYAIKRGKRDIDYLILSSICAVLAVWSKQVTIPISIAILLYLFLAGHVRVFKNYILCLLTAGALSLIFFGYFFNLSDIFFTIISVPGRQPWWVADGHIRALAKTFEELLVYCALPMIVTLFCAAQDMPLKKMSLKEWIKDNPWLIYLFAGIFMIPTSIFGRVKMGGAINALGYSTYFITCASVLALGHRAHRSDTYMREKLVISIIIVLSFIKALSLGNFQEKVQRFVNNPVSISYDYLIKHPGQAYLPWSPLAHLMAEKKAYHTYFGILDREWAGYEIGEAEFRSHVPLKAKFVAFPPDVAPPDRDEAHAAEDMASNIVMKYLPEYKKRANTPELPGWALYERE